MKEPVWANYTDDYGEDRHERAMILYIGQFYDKIPTPVVRLLDGHLVMAESVIPMQVVVMVVRILSTGEVMQLKPEAIRFDPTSSKLKP